MFAIDDSKSQVTVTISDSHVTEDSKNSGHGPHIHLFTDRALRTVRRPYLFLGKA